MINGKKVLAIIPARGGSKGLPRKNILNLAGKPLIAWTIEEAKKSNYIDRLILSSDDSEIIDVACEWGCEAPFVRPTEFSQDDTPAVEVVLHAFSALDEIYTYMVMLQPTSPLRCAKDIDKCLELCSTKSAPSCVSVTEPDKSPYWMFTRSEDGILTHLLDDNLKYLRRQDLPSVVTLNGAVYAAEVEWLKKKKALIGPETVSYLMPKERSTDIDTATDMKICSLLIGDIKQ